jgi:membrane-associated phospholipid phosphatase
LPPEWGDSRQFANYADFNLLLQGSSTTHREVPKSGSIWWPEKERGRKELQKVIGKQAAEAGTILDGLARIILHSIFQYRQRSLRLQGARPPIPMLQRINCSRLNRGVFRIVNANIALFLGTSILFSPVTYAQEPASVGSDATVSSDRNSQTPPPSSDSVVQSSPTGNFVKQFLGEEGKMWTSPFRVRRSDAKWLLPLAVGAAALFATDRRVSNQIRQTDDLSQPSRIISFAGSPFPTFGAPLALMALGKVTDNDKTLQTGELSLSAVSHAALFAQILKVVSERQRPDQGSGLGQFWRGGSSFPSGHAMSAWAIAAVMAQQYPENRWIKVSSYSFATAVSLARIGGLNHFPSDVLIGSSMGYLIGRYVVRHHRQVFP